MQKTQALCSSEWVCQVCHAYRDHPMEQQCPAELMEGGGNVPESLPKSWNCPQGPLPHRSHQRSLCWQEQRC